LRGARPAVAGRVVAHYKVGAMAFELPDIWTVAGVALALIAMAPTMTSVPSPSHWEFRISRICFIGAGLLFLAKLTIWGAQDLTPIRLGTIAIAGALIASGLAYALEWVNKKEKSVGGNIAEVQNLDRKISFNCYNSTRPTHFRENRSLHIVQIMQPPPPDMPASYGVANTFLAQGTSEVKWPDDFPIFVQKCVLANYGNTPVFRASVDLFVEWKEAEKTDNGTKAGKTLRSGFAPSPQLDLGVASQNEDYFYVVNTTRHYVIIGEWQSQNKSLPNGPPDSSRRN
jgi:hypothetical protein